MPAKNAAKFVADCLDSVLSQTYNSWELRVVNDHSTDHTLQILKQYSDRDSRIQVLENDGHGIIPALRLAFKNSHGKYVTRMDADDLMPLHKIESLIAACRGENEIATGLVSYFSEAGIGDGYKRYAQWLNQNMQSPDPFKAIYKECVIPSPCWMLHRTTLQKLGAFDPDTYPEDYDLCFRMRSYGLKVRAVGEVLHLWRDHPERSSRTDEHYTDNRFLNLKLHYFLEEDAASDIPLVLWGAGKKGKKIAAFLSQAGKSFHWITGNASKVGHDIYGTTLEDESLLERASNLQVIVAIASVDAQEHIAEVLDGSSGVEGFYFC